MWFVSLLSRIHSYGIEYCLATKAEGRENSLSSWDLQFVFIAVVYTKASDTFKNKSQKQNKEYMSYFEDLKARMYLLK